jgi:hypothetical protein
MSERTRFLYLFIFTILEAAITELFPGTENRNGWDFGGSLIGIISTAAGTWWVYRQNRGGLGHCFLERYVSLGFVFLLRFLALAIPGMFVVFMISDYFGLYSSSTTLLDVVLWSVLILIYYLGLGRQIRLVVMAECAAQQRTQGNALIVDQPAV